MNRATRTGGVRVGIQVRVLGLVQVTEVKRTTLVKTFFVCFFSSTSSSHAAILTGTRCWEQLQMLQEQPQQLGHPHQHAQQHQLRLQRWDPAGIEPHCT